MQVFVISDKINRVFWLVGEYDADSMLWENFQAFIAKNEDRLNPATLCNMCTPEATKTGGVWHINWKCPEGMQIGESRKEHDEFMSRPVIPIRNYDRAGKYDRIMIPAFVDLIDEFEKMHGIKLCDGIGGILDQ